VQEAAKLGDYLIVITQKGNERGNTMSRMAFWRAKTHKASEITEGKFPLERLDDAVCSETEADSKVAARTLPDAILGDVLLISNDAGKAMSANVFTKAKEIVTYRAGSLRIKYSVKYTAGSASLGSDVRVYRNGVAVGDNHHDTWATDTILTDDIAGWTREGTVEVWLNVEAGCTVTIKEFRLYLDNPEEGQVTLT